MSDINAAEHFWNTLADRDPLWAILSDPTRIGRWDLETFFRTGEREISTLIYQLDRLPGAGALARAQALDFGCGVGRLTQALARHYSSVVGVDVASKMIDHARRLNRSPESVTFVHNTREDLRALDDRRFDLIYSDLVLQHMAPAIALKYVDEFVRLLAPGGIAVFQLPSHRRVAAPPIVVPMSASAYRARLEVLDSTLSWRSGSEARLHVRVTNASDIAWDQASVGSIRLGNHWLSPEGAMLIQDDGRSALPPVLHPGESTEIALDVAVPDTGEHLVELDLVHEGYSWFADRGAETVRLAVGVHTQTEPSDAMAGHHQSPWDESLLKPYLKAEPTPDVAFPMYGIPRTEVETFVTTRGGVVIVVEDDDRGGQEWTGFRYFVRKS